MTALQKERQRRYESAAELSEDIRPHLEARPIHARDDTWTYLAGKFVRRNRLAVAAVLLLVASLAGGRADSDLHPGPASGAAVPTGPPTGKSGGV
ncbi:MAG: hypothetical protein ACKV2U_22400 [Bryobacteraceae bacterium]